MTGPGDEIAAAADRGHLQVSHTDREQAIDLLKAAFVQGRLTEGELDARVGQALAARTQAELATLSADLPAGLIADPPRRQLARVRPRPPVSKVAAGAGLTIPPGALLAVAFLTSNEQVSELCFMVISWFIIAWVLAGTQMLGKWYDKRSGGPLPPRPAQHGRELEGEQDNRPGGDLILSQARPGVRARHPPAPRIIRRAWRALPGRQHQRQPARLQVTA
jgi:Domain of unknown function (DUF1707)